MSAEDVLARACRILAQDYPVAQRAFVDIEVFEQLRSRRAIIRLTRVFDLLCSASETEDLRLLDAAEAELREFTLGCRRYLCDSRLIELNRIDRVRWLVTIFLLRRPFTDEAIRHYRVAKSEIDGAEAATDFHAREQHYRCAFEALEKTIAVMQPHQFYDRLFSLGLKTGWLILGFGITWLVARSRR